MRLCVHVWIDADGNFGLHAFCCRERRDTKQFGLRLDIEAMDRLIERVIDFAVGFANTGKGNF